MLGRNRCSFNSQNITDCQLKRKSWVPIKDPNIIDTTWHHRAEMALASAQQARRTITYAELAETAGVMAPQRIHQVTIWLEATIRQDHHAGLPIRAALVISRNRFGLPAPGFFETCREVGAYDGPARGNVAAEFHKALLRQLFEG